MSYLDKLAYRSTILLLWSGVILWAVIILGGLYSLLSEDKVIGYTEHGIPVLESEVEKDNE